MSIRLGRRTATAWMAWALACSPFAAAAEHPSLALTESGVSEIRKVLGSIPLFDETLATIKKEVDEEIEQGIDVPVPRDFSGGYTHERHKQNFFILQKAGALFQILGDEKYAVYVRDMLFQYEAMYKDLPLHPQKRSYARGKLFWQCLNDANWLLYVSQAYDSIYNWLSAGDRRILEDNLFRPFADFISVENPQFFNRIHNHSTWGSAAVGMIGLVMDDDELINRALFGIEDDGLDSQSKDDDGGFIRSEGQRAGFLANLEEPFSPDGYYTEGPYYQRYAMSPFLAFSQALQNAKPELEIFRHKEGVLLKAVRALLQLSDADGEFFPLNDAQKGMSYFSRELVSAVNIAYHAGGQDPQLLSIAEEQGQVMLDDSGFSVALAVRDGKAQPFRKTSVNLRDGSTGDEGGVAVLRLDDMELVFKYAAQGLSHGHYDKLSFSMYEQGDEILQDYGLVRFVNIEQKGGGNYLPENTTWAKQTIAHNTVTLNETSHFQGQYDIGSQHHSSLHFFDSTQSGIQIASAVESNAYPGTTLLRTMALIRHDDLEKPFLLDILKVMSEEAHQYDLPVYFLGQLIDVDFDYEAPSALSPLGKDHGYQHLFLEGKGSPRGDTARMTWLREGRFYSVTSLAEATDELLLTRIGANDPDFNLRRDPAFMIRRPDANDTVFVSTVESHGTYDAVSELANNARSGIARLSVVYESPNYTAVAVEGASGNRVMLIVAVDATASQQHSVDIDGQRYRWRGPYFLARGDLP